MIISLSAGYETLKSIAPFVFSVPAMFAPSK